MAEQYPTSTKVIGNKVKGQQRAKIIKNITKVSKNYYPPPEASQVPRKPEFRIIECPTRLFVGRDRDDILKEVRDYFDRLPLEQSDCWSRIVAFVGLGGIGKTELAQKFAASSRDKFPYVALINAETEESVHQSFRQLARLLKIIPYDRMKVDVDLVRQVYNHIAENYAEVLLVFDNAIRLNPTDKQFGIIGYLPTFDVFEQRFPHILITSQTQEWGRDIKKFHLDALGEEDSLQFFQKHFNTKPAEMDNLYKKLHQHLQGYPLAMTLAASNIEGKCLDDSVEELQKRIPVYLKGLEDGKIVSENMKSWSNNYNKSLPSAIAPTFERIEQEEQGAKALEFLQILSFTKLLQKYCVDSILVLGTEHLRYPEIPFLEQVIDVLVRFFTVKKFGNNDDNDNVFKFSLSIHKIVQLVVSKTKNCTKSLEGVLCPFHFEHESYHYSYIVNLLECNHVEDALPYLGILTSDNPRVDCKQARQYLKSLVTIRPERN